MTTNLSVFNSKKFGNIRVIDRDGEPWFVANDVCRALGINNSRKVVGGIKDKWKGVTISDTLGGKQTLNIINEPALYRIVFNSRKREAEAFRKIPERLTHKQRLTHKLE